MKHYIDADGNETLWQGMATDVGDHEYYCAHHPAVLLVRASLREVIGAEGIRQLGGNLYQCWLCAQEERRDIQRFLRRLACRWAVKGMRE
ncbi:MAG: hypothetical protein NZT92_03400 [Abditibacteriales bacterium]|nr:hypothetical protein [Abditibacteriales bacterium]